MWQGIIKQLWFFFFPKSLWLPTTEDSCVIMWKVGKESYLLADIKYLDIELTALEYLEREDQHKNDKNRHMLSCQILN